MPFPPGTQESDFDYEAILDKNVRVERPPDAYFICDDVGLINSYSIIQRSLESQLTSNNHTIALLRAEIEKERVALAQDQEDLKNLEEALKGTESRRRKQAKNVRLYGSTILWTRTDQA